MGAQTTINVVWAALCAYAAYCGSAVLQWRCGYVGVSL
jgi:hypothetical protein